MALEHFNDLPFYDGRTIMGAFQDMAIAKHALQVHRDHSRTLGDSYDEMFEKILESSVSNGVINPEALDPQDCKEAVFRGLTQYLFDEKDFEQLFTASKHAERYASSLISAIHGTQVTVHALHQEVPAIRLVDNRHPSPEEGVPVSSCKGRINHLAFKDSFFVDRTFLDSLSTNRFKGRYYSIRPVDTNGEPLVQIVSKKP